MAHACYKCGAYPGNPIKTLNVLKLFQCLDCGNIACIQHRDGIVGGKCAECGSTRSSIISTQINKSKEVQKGSFGSGISTTATATGGNVEIGKNILKQMQKFRKQNDVELAQKKLIEQEEYAAAQLSAAQQEKKDVAEQQLQKLMGERNLVQQASGSERATTLGASISLTLALSGDNDNNNNDTSENITLNLNDSENSDSPDKSKKEKLEFFSNASLAAPISEEKNTKKPHKQETSESDELIVNEETTNGEKNGTENVLIKKNIQTVVLHDSFYVNTTNNLNLNTLIELHKQSKNVITTILKNNLTTDIDLKHRLNAFIPLENFDKFLNIPLQEFEEHKISLITGIMGQVNDLSIIHYLDQFKLILQNKPYITGLYASFDQNDYLTEQEQEQIVLKTLDIAQENGKTVYLGLKNKELYLWQKIFNEYELSEIPFVFTDLIENQETFDFLKENNIKYLLRPDIDANQYIKFLKDYPNACFGSAFATSLPQNSQYESSKPEVLAELYQILTNIDENTVKQLLNIT